MNLETLLSPESIALIGASNREGSLGYDMVKMIRKGAYPGEIYPINPKYEEILGIKCYPDLQSIGKPVDSAVLCIAAKRVEAQVDIALEAGVQSLVIFANCVLENDTKPSLEQRIMAKCKKAGIPLLGHNAMGYYNNDMGLRACGFDSPDAGVKGNIAFISQSGSCFSTIGHNEPQLKFNLMVATGTGQVTSLSDYMIFALEQNTTKVLGVYMESIRKPERFVNALTLATEKRIPVVIMKVGKSELGAEFAKSHTGGLAGDDDAIQAVFDHYGVIRASSLDEMANTLLLFSHYSDIPQGGLVAVADSGGERNLIADDAEKIGLEFAKLSDATMNKLQSIQEHGQDAANPLDPWGTGIDFERIFGDSLALMLNDENAAIGLVSQDLRDGYFLSQGCIEALERGKKSSEKPVAFMTNFSGTRRGQLTNRISRIPAPVLSGTIPALKAIKSFLSFRDFSYSRSNFEKPDLSDESKEILRKQDVLSELGAMSILKELDIPVVETLTINNLDALEAHRADYQFPVVLKTAVKGILHKSDAGGVRTGINNYETLEEEFLEMTNQLGHPSIVAPMITCDVEMIFGMKSDPVFGPIIIVGAGGVFTEVLNDKIVLLPTATAKEIVQKIKTLKIYTLLCGYRGRQKVDIDKLVKTIKTFCESAAVLGQYAKEIDINPVAINADTIMALDALIIPLMLLPNKLSRI